MNRPTRRDIVAAAATAALLGSASHALTRRVPKPAKLFAGTRLANNRVAARFEVVPAGVTLPSTVLLSLSGNQLLSRLTNACTLVSLWAEWCVPCLAEVHDLSELRKRHAGTGFEVIALLQGTHLDPPAARSKLASFGAAELPSWIERNGATVAEAVATPAGSHGFTLPCNFLVDRHGRLRGRAFGSDSLAKIESANGELTNQGKQRMLRVPTTWSLSAADQFASALADGILDRI